MIDPTGMGATKYEDENGNELLNTEDGSDMVVTVTEDNAEEFYNNIKATLNSDNPDAIDSKEWNFRQKSKLLGVSWNQGLENMTSYWATEDAQRNAALYIQTGDMSYWSKAVQSHTASFRDPVSMAAGFAGGLYGAALFRGTISNSIHSGKQGKHIPGHNNYIAGRSTLTIEAQGLLNEYHAGHVSSVQVINEVKTRVNFGKMIGNYVDPQTGVSQPTSFGIIIDSKSGAHIVPAKPMN